MLDSIEGSSNRISTLYGRILEIYKVDYCNAKKNYIIIYILTLSYFISSIIFQYHNIQIIIVDSHNSLELKYERSTNLGHGFANRIEAINMSRFLEYVHIYLNKSYFDNHPNELDIGLAQCSCWTHPSLLLCIT